MMDERCLILIHLHGSGTYAWFPICHKPMLSILFCNLSCIKRGSLILMTGIEDIWMTILQDNYEVGWVDKHVWHMEHITHKRSYNKTLHDNAMGTVFRLPFIRRWQRQCRAVLGVAGTQRVSAGAGHGMSRSSVTCHGSRLGELHQRGVILFSGAQLTRQYRRKIIF